MELDKAKAKLVCEQLIRDDGECRSCDNCPGYISYNSGVSCIKSGWAGTKMATRKEYFSTVLISAKKWLSENLTNIYEEE
jgi:hypothetical protein